MTFTTDLLIKPPEFPQSSVRAAMLAMVALLCLATLVTGKIGASVQRITQAQLSVATGAEKLVHLEEVADRHLANALTHNDRASIVRYHQVQSTLATTIEDLRRTLTGQEAGRTADTLNRADDALLALQRQALALAEQGDVAGAQQIVRGATYQRSLTDFYREMKQIRKQAQVHSAQADAQLKFYLQVDVVLTIAAFGLIVLGWLAVLGPVRKWGEQLNNARDNLECFARELEQRETHLEEANKRLADALRRAVERPKVRAVN